MEGVVNTPRWRVEDKVREDESDAVKEGTTGDTVMHLEDVSEDELVVHLPQEERSLGWHLP